MFKINIYFIFVIISIVFFSCSGDDDSFEIIENTSDIIENINLPEHLDLDSGEVKMFTMPTPLQVASALKIIGVDYNDNLLLKNKNVKSNSDIELSLLLGMYMTDLGYTTVYNNTQKSISYAADIQIIMDKLPIAYYINDGFRKKFKHSIDNQDSLCSLILKAYNEANLHMSETENEGLGLLILTGGYIEGLYIVTSSHIDNNWITEQNNLFIQQKLFLDNFILLLDGYSSNARISSVFTKFKKLRMAFDVIEIKYNNQTANYVLVESITQKDRDNINAIISEIRNDIISN